MLNAIKKIVGSESGTNARTTPPTSTRTTTASDNVQVQKGHAVAVTTKKKKKKNEHTTWPEGKQGQNVRPRSSAYKKGGGGVAP